MTTFPFPALLADIGGTNARFALIGRPEDPACAPVRLPTASHARFEDAARAAISQAGWPKPRTLLVGAAGAVRGRAADLTNARWSLRHDAILSELGLEQGILLNDFEVLSLALPHFAATDVVPIGAGTSGPGARLVVGPGTGLGVGALVSVGGRQMPLSSEGGHVGLPPETAVEVAVLERLRLGNQRFQAEMLLAGPGLPALYRAVAAEHGWASPANDAATILARALAGEDEAARAAIAMQLGMLARFCGDMALTFMARGGVFLAGGILPRLQALIDPAAFRARFARNQTHVALLESIPISLIVAEEPAFVGLAALARRPEGYWLDYDARLWA